MIAMNKFEILGEVATSPVSKTTSKGKPFMSFYVKADKETFDGTVIPNYFEVLTWSEKMMERLTVLLKGDPIYVEGSLSASAYTNRAGERKTAISLFLNNFSSERTKEAQEAPRDPLSFPPTEPTVTIDSDDLPF